MYNTAEEVRQALEAYSLRVSAPYQFLNNKPNNISVSCPAKCSFRISFNRRKDGLLHLVKFQQHEETCATYLQPFSLRGRALAHLATPLVQDILKLRPRDIANQARSKYGAETPYHMAWAARAQVRKQAAGNYEEGFQKLQSLLDQLALANPGSKIKFETDNHQRFTRAFVSLRPWQTAAAHCRPVFTVDAAHSKARYRGVYVSLSGVDGQGHLVPIAFGIVPIENNDNWTWFCGLVAETLPFANSPTISVISDREKVRV